MYTCCVQPQPLIQRATAPELSVQQNHTPSSSAARPQPAPHSQARQHHHQQQQHHHRVVSRSQSESVALEVIKHKDMTSSRLKSEASLLKRVDQRHPRSEQRGSRTEHRRSDQLASAEEVARRVVSIVGRVLRNQLPLIFLLFPPSLSLSPLSLPLPPLSPSPRRAVLTASPRCGLTSW